MTDYPERRLAVGAGLPRLGLAAGAQLDLFAVRDWWRGPVEFHEFSGTTSCSARLNGRYAGSIHRDETGAWVAWLSLGWKIYSKSGVCSHQRCLGDFPDLNAAEAALERAARAAHSDPTLLWDNTISKEAIRKSKANGWWRG